MSRRFTRNDFDKEKSNLQNEERKLQDEDKKIDEELEQYLNDESYPEENSLEDSEHQKKEDNQKQDYEEDKEEEEEENEENSESEKSEDEQNEKSKDNERSKKDEGSEEDSENKNQDNKDNRDNEDNKNSNNKESTSEKRKNLGPNRGKEDSSSKPGGNNNVKDAIKNKALEKVGEQFGDEDGKIAKIQGAITKAAATFKSAVSGATFVGKMLVSPAFWIVVVLLIIVGAFSSSVAVIGGNDYNKACDASGVGEVSIGDDADDFTRQSAIASWLMSTPFEVNGGKPFTKEQASGILGNFIEESYGANPKTIQGDYTMKRWESCDNDCVAAFQGGGQAVGILQWDGAAGDPRRATLVKLAKSEGKQWYDLDVQLKHIKNELDALGPYNYENTQIKRSGFLDPGRSVDEYATLWAEYIERCGKCRMEDRTKSANDFYNKFQGGGGSVGSLTTQCVGGTGGAIDSSNLVQLALQISYTREEKAAGKGFGVCATLPNCGDTFSKPEFIEAKKMAEEKTGVDGGAEGLTASCDRLAATLFRLTGVDEDFPWGGSAAQIAYMNSSPKWKRVSCQERQPGDAIARTGHIMVYLGNIDGRETISSASIALASRVGSGQGRAAHLSDLSCKGDSWYADAANSYGWRRVK